MNSNILESNSITELPTDDDLDNRHISKPLSRMASNSSSSVDLASSGQVPSELRHALEALGKLRDDSDAAELVGFYQDSLQSLFSEYQNQVAAHYQAFSASNQSIRSHSRELSNESQNGGWKPAVHARFKHIIQTYALQNRPRAALVDRLILEFPQYSKSEISQHENFLSSERRLHEQRRVCRQSLDAAVTQLLQAATSAVQSHMISKAAERQREKDRLEHDIFRQSLRRKLDSLRDAAQARENEKLQHEKLEAELMEKIRRAEQQLAIEQRQDQKLLLEQYHRRKLQLQAEAESRAQAMAAIESERMKLDSEYNRCRLLYRQREYEEKMKAAEQASMAEEARKLEAAERLDALRRTVTSTLNVEIDPARAVSLTAAATAHRDAPADFFARAPLVKNVHGCAYYC
jgi:hypothetical protein